MVKKKLKLVPQYEYTCVKGTQGKHELILFFAPAKELWNCVAINQKQEDEEGGYQRATSASRVAAISRYVDADNQIPLSVLVSFQQSAVSHQGNKIRIPGKKTSGWVIDGQHRLAGASHAEKEIVLPVVAFVGLSVEAQIQQFVTINREARGVPTSLYYSLLKRLPAKLNAAEVAKERAADIGQQLKVDDEGPFGGRIVSTTSPKTGQLSLTNFVRKVAPLVADDKLLGAFSVEEQARIIANFYIAVRNVFTKAFDRPDSVFFQTIGFGALFNFFPIVFSSCLAESKSFAVADVTKVLKRIDHIDVEAWRSMGTGNSVELLVGNDLKTELRALTSGAAGSGTTIRLD